MGGMMEHGMVKARIRSRITLWIRITKCDMVREAGVPPAGTSGPQLK